MSKTTALLLIPLILLSLAHQAQADDSAEIENLRRRLEKLEGRETETEGFNITEAGKLLNIWGVVEIEAGYRDTKDLPAESDISVATALIGFDARFNDRVEGRIALLHEEGEEPEVTVDEAHLSVSWANVIAGDLTLTAGKKYLPFGNFNSSMVSDPLTLELGETSRTLLMTGWKRGMVEAQFGIFNGAHDTTGHDVIDNGVASLAITPSNIFGFGISYMCDLAETNGDLLADATTEYEDNVNALSAYLSLNLSSVTVSLEYLGALKNFSTSMLADPDHAAELTGSKPRAWFGEAAYAPNDAWSFSARYEKAKHYQDDVARYGVTGSYGLYENTVLSLEYLYSDYDKTTENKASQVTLQLALEF
ncbi:MAG: LbtU family siderophore porin [Proteobacteria bacterium]|nr:LbtU family siderophore porin [Pseudomonadota bacterium]MBU1738988.1 LbtU family siderophore porin [Pseudomonadota bacterium]